MKCKYLTKNTSKLAIKSAIISNLFRTDNAQRTLTSAHVHGTEGSIFTIVVDAPSNVQSNNQT